jgi:chemotaxis protein CheX
MEEASYVAAFIKSMRNIFEVMLQMQLETHEPCPDPTTESAHDVSAVIGLQGDVSGSVVLSFPWSTAERIVSVFTGNEFNGDNADLSDAVGELVNIVAGGAKAQIEGKKIGLGIPSVVIGSQHVVHGPRDAVRTSVPCVCDCGEFTLELALKTSRKTDIIAGGSNTYTSA